MSSIQLIHVTDMHYSGSAEDNRRIEKLVSDIEIEARAPNTLICFSGDLTQSGAESEFGALFRNFFEEMESYPRIYSCPGNHDVERSKTSKEIAEKADEINSKRRDPDEINTSPFENGCPLENYMATQGAVCNFKKNGFFTSFDVGDHFDLVSVNTSWLSRSRDKDSSDRGQLKVDEASLDEAVKQLSKEKVRILMMHHPIDWLGQPSQIYINQVIEDHFDIVLYGHEHDAGAKHVTTSRGEVVFLESSAAKAGWSHGLNGYSVVKVDVDSKAIQVKFRSYSSPRSCFIDGNDIVESGYHYPRDTDKSFWMKELSENPSHLLDRAKISIAKVDYKEVFEKNFPAKIKLEYEPIPPVFRQVSYEDGERVASRRMKISDCLNLVDGVSFFGGPRDSGLTTSSYIAYIEICNRVDDFKAIPIYVNLEEENVSKASLIREVQRGAVTSYTRREAEALCEAGGVFFLFDSVCIQESELLDRLRHTMKTYFPKCKAAVFCSLERRSFELDANSSVGFDPLEDEIFEICELTANEIKSIIDRKASRETAQVRENILNNAIISFKAMDEPVYPTTVSILVDTLKQLPDFRPINRVRLLDRYIECLLGRYTLDDVKVGHFNSSDKSNLLSYIAGVMVGSGKVFLTRNELKEAVAKYSDDMLLELPPKSISEFIDKGILFATDERVTFRADYLFSYFVAKEMVRNPDLFADITDGEKFFVYHNEIVYYGELEGVDNHDLLNRANEFITDIEGFIVSQYESHGIVFKDEWEKLTKDGSDSDGALVETLEAIASETPNELSKEISRTRDLNSRPRSRGVGNRVTIKELEAKWLITLRAYMQMMKHSTSLAGPEKIKHLRKILGSLELFAQNLAVKRDMIATQPAFRHGGIIYINPLAAFDVEKSKREFKFSAPMSVANMTSELLGSTQLNLALQKVSGSGSDFSKYIVGNLLLDIPTDRNEEIITENIISCGTQTLQVASLKSLKSKYLNYKASKEEVDFCKKIIETLGSKRSLGGKVNIQALKKQKLISDIINKKGDAGEDG